MARGFPLSLELARDMLSHTYNRRERYTNMRWSAPRR